MTASARIASTATSLATPDYSTILFTEDGGVARITLNRADKLNAFSEEMFRELQQALDRVEASAAHEGGARVLVLTGAGRGFCAGADLSVIDPDNIAATDLGTMLERSYNPLVLRLRAMPVPVLCAVNGVAAGAGASLALAGDITIAARSASFVLAFARIGLVPDAGATFLLPQRIGKARAAGLAMLGEKIDAATAEQWGLVWKCVDDAEFAGAVDAYAKRLAIAPTRALIATRELLSAAENNTLKEQLSAERDAQSAAGRGADFKEGVTAFRDKRAAQFKGR
ncbi:MAG: 2-(1,2-epoxy-1,2-dihydrophenyl)acetyl-CoA isomerase PaaG [Burkholderiaceae bacterium]